MSSPQGWEAALRAELVAAAARAHARRQRRRRLPAAAGLVIVAAALGVLALGPDPAEAEVRVERTAERIVVTLLELEADPHEVEAELREAGFDVAVEPVPAGPSAVGRFVGASDTGDLAAEVVPLDASGTSFTAFALPPDWSGSLHLHVGRPAHPGETYLGFSDAFAPGEPLACMPLAGGRADDAMEAVAERPVEVHFRRLDVPDSAPLTRDEVRGPFGPWMVRRADATAPGRVIVWLTPPTTGVAGAGVPAACGS